MPVSRRLTYDQVAARMVGVTNALGYFGQVGRALTLPAPVGWVPDPVVKDEANGDLRVKPYFVLFPGAGADGPDQPLCDTDGALALDWYVTVAGADIDDVLDLLDRVDNRILRWAPVVAGHAFGQVTRFPASRSPVLADTTVSPPRLFARPQYQLIATT